MPELLISVAVLVIIGAIIVPRFMGLRDQAKEIVAKNNENAINVAYQEWLAAGGTAVGSDVKASDVLSMLTHKYPQNELKRWDNSLADPLAARVTNSPLSAAIGIDIPKGTDIDLSKADQVSSNNITDKDGYKYTFTSTGTGGSSSVGKFAVTPPGSTASTTGSGSGSGSGGSTDPLPLTVVTQTGTLDLSLLRPYITAGETATVNFTPHNFPGSISSVHLTATDPNGTNYGDWTFSYSINGSIQTIDTSSGWPAGAYNLIATGTDSVGFTATSAPVTLTIVPAPPPRMTLELQPNTIGQGYNDFAVGHVTMEDFPSVSDAYISIFDAGGRFVRDQHIDIWRLFGNPDTSFSIDIRDMPAGAYTLYVTGTNNDGSITCTSDPVSLDIVTGAHVTMDLDSHDIVMGGSITATFTASGFTAPIGAIWVDIRDDRDDNIAEYRLGSLGPETIDLSGIAPGNYWVYGGVTDGIQGADIPPQALTVNVIQPSLSLYLDSSAVSQNGYVGVSIEPINFPNAPDSTYQLLFYADSYTGLDDNQGNPNYLGCYDVPVDYENASTSASIYGGDIPANCSYVRAEGYVHDRSNNRLCALSDPVELSVNPPATATLTLDRSTVPFCGSLTATFTASGFTAPVRAIWVDIRDDRNEGIAGGYHNLSSLGPETIDLTGIAPGTYWVYGGVTDGIQDPDIPRQALTITAPVTY